MLAFLLSTAAISLSGVMAPGPVTAATLAAGSRSRHAGAMIALGHGVLEIPLLCLLVVGFGGFLQSTAAKAGIGLVGGAVLLFLGVQLLRSLRTTSVEAAAPVQRHPFVIGIIFTAANPYFLVWWATAGLALAMNALEYGVVVLAAFALIHWLCDLGWLEILSQAGFRSSQAFGRRAQAALSAVCGLMLLGFGVKFIVDAARFFY